MLADHPDIQKVQQIGGKPFALGLTSRANGQSRA
jgi:hypothetical protein